MMLLQNPILHGIIRSLEKSDEIYVYVRFANQLNNPYIEFDEKPIFGKYSDSREGYIINKKYNMYDPHNANYVETALEEILYTLIIVYKGLRKAY